LTNAVAAVVEVVVAAPAAFVAVAAVAVAAPVVALVVGVALEIQVGRQTLSQSEFVPQPVVVLVVVVEHLAQFVVGYLTLAVVVVLVAVFLVVVVPVVVVQAREHIFVRPGLLILRTYSLLRSEFVPVSVLQRRPLVGMRPESTLHMGFPRQG